jgi:HPt (histidine-containing phosphotransfer) domain-containing protein
MSRDEAIDPAALERLKVDTGADPAMLAELVEDFLRDGARLLAEAKDAATARRGALVARDAHTLKALSGSFGASVLAARCRELEEAAGRAAGAELREPLARAEAEFERVKSALRGAVPRA